jgi:8-oxo-dGTP pyrophosphatase MutT (NUDIX family)
MGSNTSMIKHFTATVYIIHESRVLLLKHPKIHKWVPPGGHIEVNETPVEAVLREAFEETGLAIELIRDEHLWVDYSNAASFERPFMCLLENIPEHNSQPAHQHMDLIYLAKPIGGELKTENNVPLRWFTLDEVLALESEVEIFQETKEAILKINAPAYK